MTPPETMSIRPVAARRLFPQNVRSLILELDSVRLDTRDGIIEVPLHDARLEYSTAWVVLRSLTLTTPSGVFRLDGITHDSVQAVEWAIYEAQRRQIVLNSMRSQSSAISKSVREWDSLVSRDAYLTDSDVKHWLRGVGSYVTPTDGDADLIEKLTEGDAAALRRVIKIHTAPRTAADEHNDTYTREQLQKYQTFFDSVESQPLTEDQRLAVVHDEDNTLVIAGAGTGKTSTLVAKVGFLLEKGWTKPDDILLLAFTKKAADEMQERLKRRLGVELDVRTFHALGLEIVGAARGKKPSLCPEAEDEAVKSETLSNLISARMKENDFRRDYLAFRSRLRQSYKPAWEFKSQSEYTQYLLDVEPRALTGRLLKSYEECEIANCLVTNGIRFEYERAYEIDTASESRRQYKPDFYLTDYGIYIEHWGVDRQGHTASFVDNAEYQKGMDWKRELHKTHGTKLVETYSWERQEGVLLKNLEEKLSALGVHAKPITAAEALNLQRDAKVQNDPFVRLVATFLSNFKAAGSHIGNLQPKTGRDSNVERNTIFLRLFAPLFEDYEKAIHADGAVDFDDMIGMARAHIADGSYRSPFRYILVDEFQDISLGRAGLIHSLKKQVEGAKLFCVGDDWQSIYRFSGSNITLTTDFDKFFGFTKKTTLGLTFRFHDKIARFSSYFVQKNPSQLSKELTTRATSAQPGVVVMQGGTTDPLLTALTEISGFAAGKLASVLLLGRYRHTLPDSATLAALRRSFPNLELRSMTVHASKGLEAGYVIVLEVNQGKYGFPSEVADDPTLAMVLPQSEQFPFAEERRLFYVALTRAKQRVYMIGDPATPSSFLREVLGDAAYEKVVVGEGPSTSKVCPFCKRGAIVQRSGEYGEFYSCSNFPVCAFKPAQCPRCKRGWMRDADNAKQPESHCVSCDFSAKCCPRCKTGVLVERRGKWRPFYGCTNYGRVVGSCEYTERV